MAKQSGRNNPCPCGSGAKYKRCCGRAWGLPHGFTSADIDNARHRVRRFLARPGWADVVAKAEREFWIVDDVWSSSSERSSQIRSVASPGVLENWLFFDFEFEPRRTVVDAFLESTPGLSAGEQRYLRAMRHSSLQLYELVDIHVGKSITFRGLLSGEFVRVAAKGPPIFRSPKWERGAARFVPRDSAGQPEFNKSCEMLPFSSMSARDTTLADDFRKMHDELREARPDIDEVRRWGMIVPRLHAAWCRWFSRPQPIVAKDDGDPLEIATVYFDVIDPDRVATALDGTRVFMRKTRRATGQWWIWIDAKREVEGRESPMPMGWAQLVAGRRLALHVSSLNRAGQGRQLLEGLVGQHLRYRQTTCKAVSDDAATRQRIKDGKIWASQPSELSSTALAEVELATIQYYERWLDEQLPELDDKTPRQAAESPELRPRLVPIVKDFEREYESALEGNDPGYDPTWLREALNLDADLEAAGKPPRTDPRPAHASSVEPMPTTVAVAEEIIKVLRRKQRLGPAICRADVLEVVQSRGLDLSSWKEDQLHWIEALCNFQLHGCKLLRVDEATSWKIGETDFLNFDGDDLRAPFTSFAALFTDRYAARLAERVFAADPDTRLHGCWVLRSVTAYITETIHEDARHLRIAFGCDALYGQQAPDLLFQELVVRPNAKIEQLLATVQGPLRRLVRFVLNLLLAMGIQRHPSSWSRCPKRNARRGSDDLYAMRTPIDALPEWLRRPIGKRSRPT